jgi:hypothetical protein
VKISREENIGLETAVEELFNIKMKTHINLFREYAEDLFNIEDLSELSKLDQTKKDSSSPTRDTSQSSKC